MVKSAFIMWLVLISLRFRLAFLSVYYHVLLKRLLDIVGALFGLLLCGISCYFLVPQIKDGGQLFSLKDRVGKNGRIFKFYKFNSMAVDAEAQKSWWRKNTTSDGMFKVDNDPRITDWTFYPQDKVWMSCLSLECPQGDMSLVGTRPPTVDSMKNTRWTEKNVWVSNQVSQASGKSAYQWNQEFLMIFVKLDVCLYWWLDYLVRY